MVQLHYPPFLPYFHSSFAELWLLHALITVAAKTDPSDNPDVVRAKYFIRDEFLVSIHHTEFNEN